MSAHTPANEPDWDNMTEDEIQAMFDEMQAFEEHRWSMDCEDCEDCESCEC